MENLPVEIRDKFIKMHHDVDSILEASFGNLKTDITGKIQFEYISSVPRDILTDYERAQSICFVTRYESLPTIEGFDITEVNGKYYYDNYSFVRHVLNEYRPIVFNQRDSVYFDHIHKVCRQKLVNKDPNKDLSISVNHIEKGDVTEDFVKSLDENCKVIRSIIKQCEIDYIYNGILQHSDHKFTKRFLHEYASGELNYVFIKNVLLLGHVKDLLFWHYELLRVLTQPKLGPL